MALLHMQAALARVYLDSGTREALRRGDCSLADEFGLNPGEFEHLRRLVLDQADGVEIFAGMLSRKREERLSAYYPLLKSYIGAERWEALFGRYLELNAIPLLGAAADARAFGTSIQEGLAEEADDEIVSDLLTLESTKAEIADGPLSPRPSANVRFERPEDLRPQLIPPARLRRLRHSPGQLVDWVARGARSPMSVPAAGVAVVFFRGQGNMGVCATEVGPWLGSILERADGKTSLGDLLAPLGVAEDPEVIARLHEVLQELSRAGMIALNPEGLGS
jgi:hypothetical protein